MDYWQCACVFPGGQFEAVKARGLEQFSERRRRHGAGTEERIGDVKSWDDVKPLTKSLSTGSRAGRGRGCFVSAIAARDVAGRWCWIKLAIQDAVATANLLAGPSRRMSAGKRTRHVRQRRLFPTRMTQALQVQTQAHPSIPRLQGAETGVPLPIRLIDALPPLQRRVVLRGWSAWACAPNSAPARRPRRDQPEGR